MGQLWVTKQWDINALYTVSEMKDFNQVYTDQ